MNANTNITTKTRAEVGYETSKFVLGIGMVISALVGIWGAVCLASAFVTVGPLNVLKGYLTAMIG